MNVLYVWFNSERQCGRSSRVCVFVCMQEDDTFHLYVRAYVCMRLMFKTQNLVLCEPHLTD